jgi:peptide/nickel transport system substrate-binding protein
VRTSKASKFAALAVGLALVAAACSSDGKSTSTTGGSDTTTGGSDTTTGATDTTVAAPSGGTVTYGTEQEYTSYNNATAINNLFANTLVLNMVQPSVFVGLPDLTFKLWDEMMASATVTSADPQTIEYVVKPEAVWSDGEPIGCKDFWLAWVSNNGKLSHPNPDYTGAGQVDADGAPVPETLPDFDTVSTTGYEDISKLECSDDGKTITTTYAKPYADWQGLFSGLLPAHIVEAQAGVADIMTLDATKSTDDSVKAGAFWNTGFDKFDPAIDISGSYYSIDSFTQGQNLILKRNDKFWGKPGNLDSIVFLLIADQTAQPAALQNGDVQVITPQPNADLVKQLDGVEGVTASVEQGLTFEHYDFNQANKHLAKLEVRQALSLCIDRDEIVKTLVTPINPDATVLNSRIYVPAAADYKDNSGGLAPDVPKAKQLLESAGYTMGADGIYVDKDGAKLSLRLGRRDPNPRRQSTNELVIEQCKAAGIELTDDPAEDFNAVRLGNKDYDIALFAWVASALLSSNTSIYTADGGQNYNNYKNPKIQELFDKANVELDAAKRADLMNQIDQQLWADMVTLPLFQFQELVAFSDSVSNVVFNGPAGITWNANEWAVKS